MQSVCIKENNCLLDLILYTVTFAALVHSYFRHNNIIVTDNNHEYSTFCKSNIISMISGGSALMLHSIQQNYKTTKVIQLNLH